MTKDIFEEEFGQSKAECVPCYHNVCGDMDKNNKQYNKLFYFIWNGRGYRLKLVAESLKTLKKKNEDKNKKKNR